MKSKQKFLPLVLLGVLVLAGVVALGFSYANQDEPIENVRARTGITSILVEDFKFSPRVIEVAPGTEVTWTFREDTKHEVHAAAFGSERIKAGTFTHTFADPGVYDYRCSLHANITGRVVVKAS